MKRICVGLAVFALAVAAGCGDDGGSDPDAGGGGNIDAAGGNIDAGGGSIDALGAVDATVAPDATECGVGYQPDGMGGCEDVDECTAMTDNCDAVATCTNTDGGFTCECPMGYNDDNADGTVCTDQDECMGEGSGNNCDVVATCTNNDGGFTCACPMGYTDDNGDGTQCTNIDECADATDDCGDSLCVDAPGTFECYQMARVSPYAPIFELANPDGLAAADYDDPFGAESCDGTAIVGIWDLTDDQGSTITGANGLAVHPMTGEVFIIYKGGGTGRFLGTIDPTTGVITFIGDTGDNVSSIVFDGAGNLIASTGDGGNTSETVWLVDQTDASLTMIIATPNGSDGTIIGFNSDDGYVYHMGGRNTADAVDLLDISIDLTDPMNPVIMATSTVVAKTGFDYDEPFSLIYDWPTAGAFGLFNLDQELIEIPIDSTDPMSPTLDATNLTWSSGTCNPGPSTGGTQIDYVKGSVMLLRAFVPAADGTACTSSQECEGVCDVLDSNQCEAKYSCGNGVVEQVEICDDGNNVDADGCAADCGVVLLADGAACTQDFECINVCDTLDSNQCEPINTCGNAHVEGLEACDDGNLTDGDGCQMDCTVTP